MSSRCPLRLHSVGVVTNFRNSLVQKWNVAIQYQLSGQTALEVAYVGNHQSHQLFQPDPNACPNLGTTNSDINCNSLRPTPFIGGISGLHPLVMATPGYATKLERRMSKGLQFITAYTYGHALANTGTTLSGSTGFGTPRIRSPKLRLRLLVRRLGHPSQLYYRVCLGLTIWKRQSVRCEHEQCSQFHRG